MPRSTFDYPTQKGWFDSTLAVRGGVEPDPTSGSILTPIVQSATFVQQAVGSHKGHTYSRASNPTVDALERAIGAIEAGRSREPLQAVCFSSGLAAETTLFLSLLKSGDEVIVSDVVYGGTVRLLRLVLSGLGVEAKFVDTSNPAWSRRRSRRGRSWCSSRRPPTRR